MIELQNPSIPAPMQAIEIDKAIYELQLKLSNNLAWLSHDYGRAYRHIEKSKSLLYFPEVYIGGVKKDYYRVTPDNDKKGTCFFVVAKEENYDFDNFQKNYLKWKVGIVFWVNLGLINNALNNNEIFTQNLIKEARQVLTMKLGGLSFNLKVSNVEREFKEIYKEFSLEEKNEYLRSPYSGFRINCEIVMQEDCGNMMFDPSQALIDNISSSDLLNVLLPTIDFSDDDNFNSLSVQQKSDLLAKL